MRSEIPQLEVITAIADAETEDFVSQLLYSQGWSIIYRAIAVMTSSWGISDRISYHQDSGIGYVGNHLQYQSFRNR